MSNLTKLPLEDNFKTSLTQVWSGGAGAINVANTPNFTFPSGVTTYVVVNPGKSNMQIAEINAYDSGNKTLTVNNITVEKGASVNSTAQTHTVGSELIISDNYQFWADIQAAILTKMNLDIDNTVTAGKTTFTSTAEAQLGLQNVTTTQRDALTGVADGDTIYNTTSWQVEWREGGAWVANDVGGSVPNASETVAGKVEIATQAEFDAWTDTGWTGAKLVAPPSMIKSVVEYSKTAWENITAGDALRMWLTEEVNATHLSGWSTSTSWAVGYSTAAFSGGQWFLTTEAWTMKRVRVRVSNTWSPTFNMSLKVYSDTSWTLVSTSTNTIDASTVSGNTDLDFDFNAGALADATTYYALLEPDAVWDTSNYINWVFSTDSSYSDGLSYEVDNTLSWTSLSAGWDKYFAVYLETEDITRVYKTDASDATRINFIWISDETSTSGNPVVLRTEGVDDNQTGLTENTTYYLSDTPWAIDEAAGTNSVKIGKSIWTTELLIVQPPL